MWLTLSKSPEMFHNTLNLECYTSVTMIEVYNSMQRNFLNFFQMRSFSATIVVCCFLWKSTYLPGTHVKIFGAGGTGTAGVAMAVPVS